MNAAKIQLSEEELELVQNAGWLLTKNNIVRKVFELFGEVAHHIRDIIPATKVPREALVASPKISKGENYLGLPYVMLDYPRLFDKSDFFAVRTFFWWGNYFSVTLHLKGRYKAMLGTVLNNNIELLTRHQFYICVGEDEWRHELTADNYVEISALPLATTEELLKSDGFCKLSATVSFQQWQQAREALIELHLALFRAIEH
ncbi:MAG: hypothetical protein QM731_23975 [Chitinophagaceae bacterium]